MLLYAGTHGMAQGLDCVVRAASILRDQPVQFVFVGDGAEKENLKIQAAQLGLKNVLFVDPVPSHAVPSLLACADCCLVSLRPLPIFQRAVPSKIYEAMAAAKPIILAAEGEAPELLQRAQAGVTVPPGEPERLADCVRTLMPDRARCKTLGENGRRFVRENYDFDVLSCRLEELLRQIAPGALET